jgi:vacuolar-type H+-ATPase subunit I/STV1
MITGLWIYVIWVLAAGLIGLLISAIFAGVFHLRRSVFLVPYVLFVGFFLYAYFHWTHLNITELIIHNWVWGLIAALIATIFTIRNVLSQPSSPRARGPKLFFELCWFGIIYGALDGFFLSVLPVLITWQAFPTLGNTILGKIGLALLALVASELITIAYHAGYPEFRNSSLVMPAIGNGIFTLAYILSMNPISSVGGHILMHIAAVWHGTEKTVQLPPHYK